jgi:N6-L-threonylcarbamoyladenine synthase
MIVLGIETSCDDTAVGVVKDGNELLANVVSSSLDLHKEFGGVVPEIAARSHIESITFVIDTALKQAAVDWPEIDAIAVTYGAGLGGSLLIGVLTARTLAIVKKKPLYAINHVEAHLYANFLTSTGPANLEERSKNKEVRSVDSISTASNSKLPTSYSLLPTSHYILPTTVPRFPLLGLIVSGGHSQLVYFKNHFDYQLLGQTQDDAIGEAFDKVAKIIGLPYPGGPSIAKAALAGDPFAYKLPKARSNLTQATHGDTLQGDNDERTSRTSGTVSESRRRLTQQSAPNSNGVTSSAGQQVAMVRGLGKYDFSFSGLKTAVLRLAQAEIGEDYRFPSYKVAMRLKKAQKDNIAASFQRVAVETIVDKTEIAVQEFKPKCLIVGGGVSANQELRRQLKARLNLPVCYTDPLLCTDNGAMVAALGCTKMAHGLPQADPYNLEIEPNLSM